MIEAQGLRKEYGDVVAVKGVSFRVEKGDVVGLLGPNGAGKSSTIRMLTTLIPPTAGTAIISGFDVVTQADEVRKLIGYLPDTPPLYPEMRVDEYLRFVVALKGVSKPAQRSAVGRAIERTGLGEVQKRLCGTLSRGFRQRVGIAQAIAHNPPVIILDEPTSGLDPVQIVEIRQLLAGLGGEHTVILSTHVLQEVSSICSRVIMIARGGVVLEGALSELTRDRSLEANFLEALGAPGGGV